MIPWASGAEVLPMVTARLLLHPLSVREAERIVARAPLPGDLWAEGYPQDGDVRGCGGFLRGSSSGGPRGLPGL